MKIELQVVYNREGEEEFSITEIYLDERGFRQGRRIERKPAGWREFEQHCVDNYSMNQSARTNGRKKITDISIVIWDVDSEKIRETRKRKEALVKRLSCLKVDNCNGCMECE